MRTYSWSNRAFCIALALLLLAAATALIDGRSDMAMTSDELAPPSATYWLGTNDLGQDILLRTWLATPDSLLIALGTGIIAPLLSLIYALWVALGGVRTQQILLRLIDMQIAFPSFLLAILIAAYIQPNTSWLLLLLIVLEWPRDVRELFVLAQLEVQRDSFLQARQFGASFAYLLYHHLLPRILPNVSAIGISVARRAVLHAAGLAFLGVTDPSIPTWGGMIADVIPLLYMPQAISLIIAPALALMALMSLLTLGGYLLEKQVFIHASQAHDD